MREALDPGLTLNQAQRLLRLSQVLKAKNKASAKRIAVLGSFSTQHLSGLIGLYCLGRDLDLEIYEADYGVLNQEILDPRSGLAAFNPELIYLALDYRAAGPPPALSLDAAAANEAAERTAGEWVALWTGAYHAFQCPIIQDNFAAPSVRVLGNHELRHASSLGRHLASVNALLQEEAPSYVTLHDVEFIASQVGRRQWFDERFYHHAKLACAPDLLPRYAHSVASVVAALFGKSRKCLVLDLDNTLWGGVIGDDGIGGIRLGQGEAEGEAYQSFQRYVKGLASRGVILAVCSKNEEAVCKEAFEKHPGMVLALTDISCFVANWRHKPENIEAIARALEIGLDSLVFVDDNPAEREIVRQMLPQVAVPELPEDPSGYAAAIDSQGYFQTVSVSQDDLRRTQMYQANARRQAFERAASNVEDFLRSLEMKARVEPVNGENLERVSQLVARSNQFNLTTRRRTAAELIALKDAPNVAALAFSLADRLGDSGLISVVIVVFDGLSASIDTWLMSCRVLRRGVEQLVLNRICAEARRRGVTEVMGEYLPTPKNRLVEDHYPNLGFSLVSRSPEGRSTWRLQLDAARDLVHFIATDPST